MLKKSVLVIMAMAMSQQASAAFSSEPGDSLWTEIKKAGFEFVYYGASPLIVPIGYLFEIKGRLEQKEVIVQAVDDLTFFADNVVATEPGEYGFLYKKIVIQPKAGDVVTVKTFTVENGQNVGHETVVEHGNEPLEFANYSAVDLKINGREVVSNQVAKAHEAAKNLIYDGVIEVPESLRTGVEKTNVWVAANTATISNKLALDYAKKELAGRQRIRNRYK